MDYTDILQTNRIMKDLAVGIDIGGTNTVIGLVSKNGKCMETRTFRTDEFKDYKNYYSYLKKEIKKIVAENKSINIIGVGIGAPNGNHYKGTIENPPNLPWRGVLPICESLSNDIKLPVSLTNDANAAAIGEKLFGQAKKMNDFVVITLGTGLGSGIYVNGNIVHGYSGFAGELGHMIVMCDGRTCQCGKQGCLETYASATGIKRTIFELMSNMISPSVMREIPGTEITSKLIHEQALKGDIIALNAFEITGKILGKALSNVVTVTEPEAFFLLGGLALAGDFIFEPVRRHFEQNINPIYKGKIKIMPSGLDDNMAPVLGSAALAWKNSIK